MDRPIYTELLSWMTPPTPRPKTWYQDRGRRFEALLVTMMKAEHMAPTSSFRPDGEEIDGSFHHNHRTFLMEAKWRSEPSRASDLYAFKGKVDGKLIGTIGVFFSMSDYSLDAVDALQAGKELNIILFGASDILAVAKGDYSLQQALDAKLRYAAQYGWPYYDLTERTQDVRRKVRPSRPRPQRPDMMGFELTPDLGTTNVEVHPTRKFSILVEGAMEEQALSELFQRLTPKIDLEINFKIAGGQLGLAKMTRYLLQNTNGIVVVVVDADLPIQLGEELAALSTNARVRYIPLSPTFETVFEDACDVAYINAAPPTSIVEKTGRRLGNNADIEKLKQASQPLAKFLDELNY